MRYGIIAAALHAGYRVWDLTETLRVWVARRVNRKGA